MLTEAQPQGQGLAAQSQGKQMPTVEQVIMMLQQGATPEQLLAAGIPEELLRQALQMMEQQGPQQQAPVPEGLAGMQMQQG